MEHQTGDTAYAVMDEQTGHVIGVAPEINVAHAMAETWAHMHQGHYAVIYTANVGLHVCVEEPLGAYQRYYGRAHKARWISYQ